MIWEYDHEGCIGKDLEEGGYSLFQGATLENLRKISVRSHPHKDSNYIPSKYKF
jgi:hypothetical protein